MILIIWAVIIIAVIVGGYLFWDKRYKKPQHDIPKGYTKTEEVNLDPVSGEKSRVYYNEQTGDRLYIKEEDHRNRL